MAAGLLGRRLYVVHKTGGTAGLTYDRDLRQMLLLLFSEIPYGFSGSLREFDNLHN